MRNFVFILFLLAGATTSHAQVAWSLDSCIQYAFANNIQIRQTALNMDLARLDQKTAIGGLLPNLNAQGSHGYNWGQRIDPFTNQFATERIQSNSLGIATSFNLFSGFQQVNSVKQANLGVEASKWNYEKACNDLALNVATAYLTVLLNRELLVIAESNVRNTQTQVDRIGALVRAGQAAQGNLEQIESQLASDQATLVSARNNHDLALLQLMQLLQLDPSAQSTFEISVPDLGDVEALEIIGSPEIAVSMALNNFPEIRAAQTNVAMAETGEAIARGGRYPRLTASYSYGTGYSGAAQVLSGSPDSLSIPIGTVLGSNQLVFSFPQAIYTDEDFSVKPFNDQLDDNVNQSLFFNLTIPIFNGFSTEAGISRARINRMNAELQLEQSRQTLRQEVERAYADARAALATYNASRISEDASARAFGYTEKRYEQGMANAAEYADARIRLDNARASTARSKYEFVFRIKILEFYMGKPISLK